MVLLALLVTARNVQGRSCSMGIGEWVGQAGFTIPGGAGERAEGMRKRAIAMGSGDGIGFSLEG